MSWKCPKSSQSIGEGNEYAGDPLVSCCMWISCPTFPYPREAGSPELAGPRLDWVKLLPAKPPGAAWGPYEEKQTLLWLTHGSGQEKSCLIAIQSIFTLPSPALSLHWLLFSQERRITEILPQTESHQMISSASESRPLFNVSFICPQK